MNQRRKLTIFLVSTLPPAPPPFEISPPRGGGDCHFAVLLGNIYCGGL